MSFHLRDAQQHPFRVQWRLFALSRWCDTLGLWSVDHIQDILWHGSSVIYPDLISTGSIGEAMYWKIKSVYSTLHPYPSSHLLPGHRQSELLLNQTEPIGSSVN